MAVGDNFSLALSNKGEVYTWGINSDGQLGHGHKSDTKTPKKISVDFKTSDIAAGDSHSIILSSKFGISLIKLSIIYFIIKYYIE